uniref:non-specific serine/threonine protein kinase n=1 Tax=Globodera pallida TaxID=36090 RepID=A0A183C738_GLOPA
MGEAVSKSIIEVGKIAVNMKDKVIKSADFFERKLCSFYDFKDLREIGAGAFGTVYYGKEPPSNRDVALKRIKLTKTDVVKEVNILKSFSHPNIVKCFYSFEEVSRGVKYHVLVLEYVNGGDLETWLKRKTNDHRLLVPEADIWRVFTQIADAVRYIHARCIIHRDLKPSNVLLTKTDTVKLADFGISRQQNAESFAHTVCGTPYYMSPECILEQPYTTKTDIWSLGCILYEMATLRSPFFGHKGSLMQKIRDAEYPPFPARCCYTEQLKLLVQRYANKALANKALALDQTDGLNDEEDINGANIPSAGIVGGEDDETEDEEEDDDEEEEEKEEDEEENEDKKSGDQIDDDEDANRDDEEELMLARLKEAAAMARKRQKEAVKLKAKQDARKEAEKRERSKEEHRKGAKGRKKQEEEELEKEEEKEDKEEEKEEEVEEDKEDTRRPRMNLLKQRKKLPTKFDEEEEEKQIEEEAEEEEYADDNDDDDDHGVQEGAEPTVVAAGELIATRKRPIYNRKALTNRYDYKHRSLLDAADFLLEKHDFDGALKHYEQILASNKHSPRSLYGRARLHQLRAEFADEHDNAEQFIQKAISDYNSVLENEETPDELFKMTVHHFVECARFVGGQHHKILQAQRALVDRFPTDADIQCELGATWLGMARPEKAASIFRNVLDAQPGHALALAYLGYIQKVHEGALERGVHALRRAMRVHDARLGRHREALQIYAEAVRHGIFPSVLQRSVHNLQSLSAHPWWSVEHIECAKQLRAVERQWTAIRGGGTN